MSTTLVEGATLKIGATLVEGAAAALKIGAARVEGATVTNGAAVMMKVHHDGTQ